MKKLVKDTLIHFVIEGKDLKFCQMLITNGFDVNSIDYSGCLPVHVAAQEGDSLVIKELIKSNATINATNHANQTPLHLAAKNGHKDVFDILKSLMPMTLEIIMVKLQKITHWNKGIIANFLSSICLYTANALRSLAIAKESMRKQEPCHIPVSNL